MLHRPLIEVVLSREGSRGIDRAAVDELGMPSLLLMENAASAVAEVAEEMLGGQGARDGEVVVLSGPGNNGGDGFAAARKLHNLGRRVTIVLIADRAAVKGDALVNLVIVERMGLEIRDDAERETARGGRAPALVIDGLLGTGQTRPVSSPMDRSVAWINAWRDKDVPVLAVDIPTGLDCDTGAPLGSVVVRASRTVTLAGMKKGFLNPASRAYTGDVIVGDIGVPAELLRRFAERD